MLPSVANIWRKCHKFRFMLSLHQFVLISIAIMMGNAQRGQVHLIHAMQSTADSNANKWTWPLLSLAFVVAYPFASGTGSKVRPAVVIQTVRQDIIVRKNRHAPRRPHAASRGLPQGVARSAVTRDPGPSMLPSVANTWRKCHSVRFMPSLRQFVLISIAIMIGGTRFLRHQVLAGMHE